MTNEQERTEQIVNLARKQMREHAPQYTFKDKTAFLYVGQVQSDGKYVVGLLETDPKDTSYPFCMIKVIPDDPLAVINYGLGLLESPDYSFKFWRYINHFESSGNIEIVPVANKLEELLQTCIKKQSIINAHKNGVSYLNEQVKRSESK